MTDYRLSRRRLLALAGATVTAGCGQGGSNINSTRFARNDRKAKSVATATASDDAAVEDSSVEINIETETETKTERREQPREDPEGTQTPEPTPTGAERLEMATQYLNESLDAYANVDGTSSVLEVDASTTAFDAKAVRAKVSKANTALDEAKQAPDVDDQTVTALRTAGKAVDKLVACQVAVIEAYEQFDRAFTGIFDEEFHTARSALSKLELKRSQASDTLETFTRETAASDFARVEGISNANYSSKIEQFSAEITGFEEVHDPMDRFRRGVEKFAGGVDLYVGKSFRNAQRELLSSLNGFEISATNFRGVKKPNSLGDQIGDLRGAAGALKRGTDDLIESCRAGRNHNSGDRQSNLNNAIRGYNRSGDVRSLPSYEELKDEM